MSNNGYKNRYIQALTFMLLCTLGSGLNASNKEADLTLEQNTAQVQQSEKDMSPQLFTAAHAGEGEAVTSTNSNPAGSAQMLLCIVGALALSLITLSRDRSLQPQKK